MPLTTTLRADAFVLDRGAVPAALLLDAAFAGALAPGDPALPPILARLARGEERATLHRWATAAVEAELRDWYGARMPAVLAVHRGHARSAIAAALAGDGDAPAVALACLCGEPATPRERRRLEM